MGSDGLIKLDTILKRHSIEIVPVTSQTLLYAREGHMRFGKGKHKAALNYGDCFAYGLCKEKSAPLLFKGDDFVHTDVEAAYSA